MPIHAARDLQFRSDSVAARLYQERLYSSGPAGAIMHEVSIPCFVQSDSLIGHLEFPVLSEQGIAI